MASQTHILLYPPARLDAPRATQRGAPYLSEDDDKDVHCEPGSSKSPYALDLHDLRSISSNTTVASQHSGSAAEYINLGPSPSPGAPASLPVFLPSAARFNRAQDQDASTGPKEPNQKVLSGLHIGSRVMTLAGAEALTAGLLHQNRGGAITGGVLLASGTLSTLGSLTAMQVKLRTTHPRMAHALALFGTAGLAALGGGGVLRQLGINRNNELLTGMAMLPLAAGAAEAALSGGLSLALDGHKAADLPDPRRAQVALWTLDAGVVTAMVYGLATRLNRFSPIVDSAVLGAAYTATLAGVMLQYADGAWFKRSNVAITPRLTTTWGPTAMVSVAFLAKIAVLVGVKFAVDGVMLDNATYTAVGSAVTIASFVGVITPQLSYFHPDLKSSQHPRPKLVTAAVILGAFILAAGSSLREWAAVKHNLPLARWAMAIAGLGALSVVACSSISLAASEDCRGRAPLRHRPEVALGLQTVGIAIGVAYGLGIRSYQYSIIADDVALAASYLTVGIGGAMAYASGQLDRASLLAVVAEERVAGPSRGEAIAMEPIGWAR